MIIARWPHPSPWWGEEFWPWVIVRSPLLLVAVIVDGMITWYRRERR